MSRRLRYQVAVSLDGFIAGPDGEHGWIVMDPSIDFATLFKEFDTAVMGHKTYEVLTAQGGAMSGLDVVVFSRTLPAAANPGVRILNDDPRVVVPALKAKPGRDIWLYGGGVLFRSLLDAGLVDTVEVAVIPVLLGAAFRLALGQRSCWRTKKHSRPAGSLCSRTRCPGALAPFPAFGTSRPPRVGGRRNHVPRSRFRTIDRDRRAYPFRAPSRSLLRPAP